jgi:hypothetical protein
MALSDGLVTRPGVPRYSAGQRDLFFRLLDRGGTIRAAAAGAGISADGAVRPPAQSDPFSRAHWRVPGNAAAESFWGDTKSRALRPIPVGHPHRPQARRRRLDRANLQLAQAFSPRHDQPSRIQEWNHSDDKTA